MIPEVRRMSVSMALQEFEDAADRDEVFPIIMIGRTRGPGDEYKIYSLRGASSDLVGTTLLKILIADVGGIEKLKELLIGWEDSDG